MPSISVVICTVNRPELIRASVDSVLGGSVADLELVVVDQSPGPETREAVADLEQAGRLRYIHSDLVGLSAAYNTGIAATSGPIIAFTDDDCVAAPEWAASVLRAFADTPDADLLYGQVCAPPGFDVGDGVLPTLEFEQRRLLRPQDRFEVFGMGANFAARRSLFQRVGGFDEVLGGGGPLRSSQDSDLQYRVYRAGRVCLIEPTVRVLHYGLRRADQWDGTLSAYGEGDGGFYMKHVRCGDLTALRGLGARLGREMGRTLVKPLLGRRHSRAYLSGLLAGAVHSFRYPVDKGTRIYSSGGGR